MHTSRSEPVPCSYAAAVFLLGQNWREPVVLPDIDAEALQTLKVVPAFVRASYDPSKICSARVGILVFLLLPYASRMEFKEEAVLAFEQPQPAAFLDRKQQPADKLAKTHRPGKVTKRAATDKVLS